MLRGFTPHSCPLAYRPSSGVAAALHGRGRCGHTTNGRGCTQTLDFASKPPASPASSSVRPQPRRRRLSRQHGCTGGRDGARSGKLVIIANAQQPPWSRSLLGKHGLPHAPQPGRTTTAALSEDEEEDAAPQLDSVSSVSGATMQEVLRHLWPPLPIIHTGLVGANSLNTTANSLSDRRCLQAVAQQQLVWSRFLRVAPASAATAMLTEHLGGASEDSASPHAPCMFAQHAFLPHTLQPLASPLRATVGAITGTSFDSSVVSASGGGGGGAGGIDSPAAAVAAQALARCPLPRWPEAPSLYPALVAPLQHPASFVEQLRWLALVHEQQQTPSMVLVEERPGGDLLPLSRPRRGTGEQSAAGQVTGRSTHDTSGEEAGSQALSYRRLELQAASAMGGVGVPWRLSKEVAVVEGPVVVSVERVLVTPAPAADGNSPQGRDGGEPRGSHDVLVETLRRAQRDFLQRHEQFHRRARETASAAIATATAAGGRGSGPSVHEFLPWVWTGDGWFMEVDPHLACAAAGAVTHVSSRGGVSGPALAIPAWLPPWWSVRSGSLPVLPSASPRAWHCGGNGFSPDDLVSGCDTDPTLTLLLQKTWTLAGAGSLAAALANAAVCAAHDASAVYESAQFGSAPGAQNALSLFPNYDAETGLAFTASSRAYEDVADKEAAAAERAGAGQQPSYEKGPQSDALCGDAAKVMRELLPALGEPGTTIRATTNDDDDDYDGHHWMAPAPTQQSCEGHSGKRCSRGERTGAKKRRARGAGGQRLTRWSHLIGRGAQLLQLFELSYVGQAVCWLKATAAAFTSSNYTSRPVALVPVRRVALLCDPVTRTGEGERAEASSGTPEEEAAAAATLYEEAYLTVVDLLDGMPTWLAEAFDGTEALTWLQSRIPVLDPTHLVTHGAHHAAQSHEGGDVYVLQLTTGPADEVGQHGRSGKRDGGHRLFTWHRYNAADTRVNFLYTLTDACRLRGKTAAGTARAQWGGALGRCPEGGGDVVGIQLREADALFIDVRCVLLLLSSTFHASEGPNSATGKRPNVVEAYEKWLHAQCQPHQEPRTASFAVRYGASHFVDCFVAAARQPLQWSFDDVGAAMAAQVTESPDSSVEDAMESTAQVHPPLTREPQTQVKSTNTATAAAAAAPAVHASSPGQDAFLRTLEMRRVDEEGYTETDPDVLSSVSELVQERSSFLTDHHSPPTGDLPALDPRALRAGSRLYEAYTHPCTLARLARPNPVTLGNKRTSAILSANQKARLQRRAFSRRKNHRVEEEIDTVEISEEGSGGSLGATSTATVTRTAAGTVASSQGCRQRGEQAGKGHGSAAAAGEGWRVEQLIRIERDRTAARWAPWMKVIAPAGPRRRPPRRGRTAHKKPREKVVECILDNSRNVRDANIALQALVSSPLAENTSARVSSIPARSASSSSPQPKPQQPQQAEDTRQVVRLVHSWDLGLMVLHIQYKELYVNAVNTAFPGEP